MALEKASESHGEAGAGLGLGVGLMAPAMLAEVLKSESEPRADTASMPCPACQQAGSPGSRFCNHCGKTLVVFNRCPQCSANLGPERPFLSPVRTSRESGAPGKTLRTLWNRQFGPTPSTAISAVCESNAVNTSSWQIEHACPQCGAPVVLEETDRLLVCGHCRVKLYLSSDRCFSYLLPPPSGCPGTSSLAPYWRVKGMMFSCEGHEIGQKVIDSSFQAGELKCLPISLGYRPQAMRLRFVLAETPGRFLQTTLPLEQVTGRGARQRSRHRIGSAPSGPILSSLSGRNRQYHLCAIRPAGQYPPRRHPGAAGLQPRFGRPKDAPETASPAPEDRLHFIATLCPYCGWDLQGDKDSHVLLCANCDSAWQAALAAMERVAFEVFPGGAPQSIYLPFWRIKVPVEGICAALLCGPGATGQSAQSYPGGMGGPRLLPLVTRLQDSSQGLSSGRPGDNPGAATGSAGRRASQRRNLPRDLSQQ